MPQRRFGLLALTGIMLVALGCSSDRDAIFAPSGAILALRILNPAIVVNGVTTIIVTADQSSGAPVEDGTEVAMTAATGTLSQHKLRTQGGRASVIYTAASVSGLDLISASAGGALAELAVHVTSSAAAEVQLSATPETLPAGGGTSTITAVLLDAAGAPVIGATVLFTATSGTLDATSVVSDSAGKAAIAIETVEPATVQATVEGGPSAEYFMAVRGVLSIRATGRPAEPQVGTAVTFTVTARQGGGTAPAGRLKVSYGDGKRFQQRLEGRTTIKHVYTSAGTYTAEVEFVADNGDTAKATATVVVVPIPVTFAVVVSSSPAQPQAGDLVTFTVTTTQSDGGRPNGQVSIAYGDGGTYQQPINGTATMTHVYATAGSFTTTVEFVADSGAMARATVTVVIEAAPVPGDGADEIDLSQVIWLHHDVSGWAKSSTVTHITHADPPICIEHTKAGAWPAIDDSGTIIEGNPWVFVQISGQWYAATYEWLRPGQTCKNIDAGNIGAHIKIAPLDSWRPRSGEVVGFMVSTPARFGPNGPKNERSNVVRFVWP